MKTYLAVYTGSKASRKRAGWDELDPAERKAREERGLQAWGAWMAKNADEVVFAGGPLGKTKQVSEAGVADVTNALVGFMVVNAASHEEAARKFESHPHFTIFPGEAVEIMECLPLPGM